MVGKNKGTFIRHLPSYFKQDSILQVKLLSPVFQAREGRHREAAR